MKKIYYITGAAIMMLSSCVTAGSSSGEESGLNVAPPQNIKTSSDMNITPDPNTVPDGPEPQVQPMDSINNK
jgi:hypothetical protein